MVVPFQSAGARPPQQGSGMAFEFATMRDRVQHDVWLNTDFFAEEITYRPMSGHDLAMTVHIDGGRDLDVEDSLANTERETIRVLISRVADEDNTKGYLLKPVVGDQILRSRTLDPTQEPYIFAGEIDEQGPSKWRLVFERYRAISQGVGR